MQAVETVWKQQFSFLVVREQKDRCSILAYYGCVNLLIKFFIINRGRPEEYAIQRSYVTSWCVTHNLKGLFPEYVATIFILKGSP